jgi:hypothetical protein
VGLENDGGGTSWSVHVKADLGEWIEAGVWSTLAGALQRPPYPWEMARIEMRVRVSADHSLHRGDG